MNFQQLRIIRETVRQDYNLTEVGNVLFTSQSGISKHIKDLEDELGVDIFLRKGKRLLGLTEPGKELLLIVERMLLDTQNIKKIADQFSQNKQGQLTIATTHTQARYALPKVIQAFKKEYPKVHLALHQGSPDEISAMLLEGKADIGIATESIRNHPELIAFPYYTWHHCVIVPKSHPLSQKKKIELSDLEDSPIVTYHDGFTGRQSIDDVFRQAKIIPEIVMSALDADVIKTYVELDLGVGIIAEIAYQEDRDTNLKLLDTKHLFPENTTSIAIRKGNYLRGFAYHFLQLCTPKLTQEVINRSLENASFV